MFVVNENTKLLSSGPVLFASQIAGLDMASAAYYLKPEWWTISNSDCNNRSLYDASLLAPSDIVDSDFKALRSGQKVN